MKGDAADLAAQLRIYNTLTRSKERFVPRAGRRVEMFVCGQTVYDDAHLGHAKTYINFDIVARWLRHLGYDVRYIQNITDVDDKIIARAQSLGIAPLALARKYEKRFMADMEALRVKASVDMFPRASDFINEMAEQIQALANNGYAYALGGDIYYDVARFGDYTQLSRMKVMDLTKHRVEPREGKRNVYDFALWKSAKPGEPSWKIWVNIDGEARPFVGRPGWHMEDTAITRALFGPQYDLHGGAIELLFPHHTNEIAQAEAADGVHPFVRYWMHSGVLTIKGEKMSKSLKNFVRIGEIVREYGRDAVRIMVLSTHYRKEIAYTEDLLQNCANMARHMNSSMSLISNVGAAGTRGAIDKELRDVCEVLVRRFEDAMNDDFNTPLALSALSEAVAGLRSIVVRDAAAGESSRRAALGTVARLAGVLGLLEDKEYERGLPSAAAALIERRERLRKEGDFAGADTIRATLLRRFRIAVEDTRQGPIWYVA